MTQFYATLEQIIRQTYKTHKSPIIIHNEANNCYLCEMISQREMKMTDKEIKIKYSANKIAQILKMKFTPTVEQQKVIEAPLGSPLLVLARPVQAKRK